jgi:hypothetical protein
MTREYNKTGIYRARGVAAISAKTVEGRAALKWRNSALKAKGGANCPDHLHQEINDATFDLYRKLLLQSFIIDDANRRGTIVNRRKRELGNVHAQYDQIDARYMKRRELLKLDKTKTMPNIRDLIEQRKRQAGGMK